MLRPRADGFEPGADGLQALLDMEEQQPAGVGEFDAAIDAVEQAGCQLLLQALDLLAHRRLGGTQFHSGSREAEMTGGGLEHPQQVQGQLRL
ncbi:hypothetical protein D3C81_2074460 [compost metagenome]